MPIKGNKRGLIRSLLPVVLRKIQDRYPATGERCSYCNLYPLASITASFFAFKLNPDLPTLCMSCASALAQNVTHRLQEIIPKFGICPACGTKFGLKDLDFQNNLLRLKCVCGNETGPISLEMACYVQKQINEWGILPPCNDI